MLATVVTSTYHEVDLTLLLKNYVHIMISIKGDKMVYRIKAWMVTG